MDNEHAKESLSLAYATTHSTDEKRRIEHIWGPGDGSSVEQLKEAVSIKIILSLKPENFVENMISFFCLFFPFLLVF